MCVVKGTVYAWGGSLHKKLGTTSQLPSPVKKLMKKKIVNIDCGD